MSCGVHLDATLGASEEIRFLSKHRHMVRRLSKELHFTYTEIESLLLIYHKLQKQGPYPDKGITRTQLLDVMHNGLDVTDKEFVNLSVTALEIQDRITSVFPMESWLRTMSLLLRGTVEEKLRHCFSAYDIHRCGMITRSMVNSLLSNCIIGDSPDDVEDSVRDLADILTSKMDVDRDGRISFADYRETVLKQPLCMESLGACLPSRIAACAFLKTFTPHVGNVK